MKCKRCIVCGFEPHLKEKSIGCYHWHKKISNRHTYKIKCKECEASRFGLCEKCLDELNKKNYESIS